MMLVRIFFLIAVTSPSDPAPSRRPGDTYDPSRMPAGHVRRAPGFTGHVEGTSSLSAIGSSLTATFDAVMRLAIFRAIGTPECGVPGPTMPHHLILIRSLFMLTVGFQEIIQ